MCAGPRNVRKLSKAPPVRPSALAHQASCSCSSFVFATTAPPTQSLWPLMYLVVECTTMSAPSSSGRCHAGDRKVLSTTTSVPLPLTLPHQRFDVGDAQQRIARCFDPQQVGLLRERGIQFGRITKAHEVHLHFIALVPGREQAEGAAVAVVWRDDARALWQQVTHQRDGAHAGTGDDAACPALEISQRIAQQIARGIARARVVVLALVAVAAEGIGGTQVQRRNDGSGHIIGFKARPHGTGGEARSIGHVDSPG